MSPQPHSTGATNRILSITELLTTILSFVEVHTLLHAQRVCHSFKSAIATTPALQQRLFFLPGPPSSPQLVTYEDEFPERYVRRIQLNPLLLRSFPTFFPNSATSGSRQLFSTLDWAARRAAYARPEASWRRMLLCAEPVDVAVLTWRTGYATGERVRRVDLGPAGGVRMGLVYDLVEDLIVEKGRFGSASFSVDWNIAEAITEEEWNGEHRDWKESIIMVENTELVMHVGISHFHGCIPHIGEVLEGFRSEAADAVDFETYERLNPYPHNHNTVDAQEVGDDGLYD